MPTSSSLPSTGAEAASSSSAAPKTDEDSTHEDAVFLKSYIPRNLNQVFDPERDADRVAKGEGEELIYAGHTGIAEVNRKAVLPDGERNGEKDVEKGSVDEAEAGSEDETQSESEGSDNESEGGLNETTKQPRGHRHEDREAKKVSGLFSYSVSSVLIRLSFDH